MEVSVIETSPTLSSGPVTCVFIVEPAKDTIGVENMFKPLTHHIWLQSQNVSINVLTVNCGKV
jgi:hypothetical protein